MGEYTTADIAAHCAKDDLWVAIHGKVYDVTSYVRDHPGGSDILMDVAGKDGTEGYDDAGHSEDASEILGTFLLGTLKGAREVKPKKKTARVMAQPTSTQLPPTAPTTTTTISPILTIVSVPAGAVLFYLLAKSAFGAKGKLASVIRLLPDWTLWPKGASASTTVGSTATFGGGFLSASILWSILSGYAGSKISARLTAIDSGFMQFPPHTKSATRVVTANPLLERGFLHAKAFEELPLVEKTEIATNVYRYVFQLPNATDVIGLPIGQHVSIKATVNGQSVSRSYTPTSNNSDKGRLELVIRCYPDGLLTGQYLARLQVGDRVAFRGPKGAMRYKNGLCGKIGMIAGGTGITPMYQLIRAICEDDTDTTEVSLVYANRSETDILLRHELEAFARKYPKNLKIWYMLDKPPADWAYGSGYVTADVLRARLPAPGTDTKILLCGPPGMVNASKKDLLSLGFAAHGTMSKMSDQVFCF